MIKELFEGAVIEALPAFLEQLGTELAVLHRMELTVSCLSTSHILGGWTLRTVISVRRFGRDRVVDQFDIDAQCATPVDTAVGLLCAKVEACRFQPRP